MLLPHIMKEVSRVFVAACSRTILSKIKKLVSKDEFTARQLGGIIGLGLSNAKSSVAISLWNYRSNSSPFLKAENTLFADNYEIPKCSPFNEEPSFRER